MKKGKILGIGNKDRYSYFVFKKNSAILLILTKMISGISYKDCSGVGDTFLYDIDHMKDTKRKRKISEFVDDRSHFSGKGFDVDVIFGKNKVFLLSYANEEITKYLRKFVSENFEFKLTKKQLNLHKKAGKKIK